jgi:NADH dehydrogenase FAD-containing subunit
VAAVALFQKFSVLIDIKGGLRRGSTKVLPPTGGSASAHAARFLTEHGVTLLTGERIESPLPPNGYTAEPGEARTASGKHIAYDIMLRCIGGRPNTEYLRAHFRLPRCIRWR